MQGDQLALSLCSLTTTIIRTKETQFVLSFFLSGPPRIPLSFVCLFGSWPAGKGSWSVSSDPVVSIFNRPSRSPEAHDQLFATEFEENCGGRRVRCARGSIGVLVGPSLPVLTLCSFAFRWRITPDTKILNSVSYVEIRWTDRWSLVNGILYARILKYFGNSELSDSTRMHPPSKPGLIYVRLVNIIKA